MQRRKQRFVEADYYELDWYYEECTDGETVGLFGSQQLLQWQVHSHIPA